MAAKKEPTLVANEEAAEKKEPEALRAEDNNKQSAEKAALNENIGYGCESGKKQKAKSRKSCDAEQDVLQGWGKEIESEPEQQKESQVQGEGCIAKEDLPTLASFGNSYLVSLLKKLDDDEEVLETLKAIDKLEIPIPIAKELEVVDIIHRHGGQPTNRIFCCGILNKLLDSERDAKREEIDAFFRAKKRRAEKDSLGQNNERGFGGEQKEKAERGEVRIAKQDVPTLASFDKSYLASLLKKLNNDDEVLKTLEAVNKMEIPVSIAAEFHVGSIVRRHADKPVSLQLCRSIFDKLLANEMAAKKKGIALSVKKTMKRNAEKAALNECNGHGCEGGKKRKAEGGESCKAKQAVLQGCEKESDSEPQQQKESQVRGKGCLPREDVPTLASFDKPYLASLLKKLENDEKVLETLEAIEKMEIPFAIAEELHFRDIIRCHGTVKRANREVCRSILDKLVANEMAEKEKEIAALKAEWTNLRRNLKVVLKQNNGKHQRKVKAEGGAGCSADKNLSTLASFNKQYVASLLGQLKDNDKVVETLEAIDQLEIPFPIAKELHVVDIIRRHLVALKAEQAMICNDEQPAEKYNSRKLKLELDSGDLIDWNANDVVKYEQKPVVATIKKEPMDW